MTVKKIEEMKSKFPEWWSKTGDSDELDREKFLESYMTHWWLLISELAAVSQSRDKAVIPLSRNVSACLFLERGKEKDGRAFTHAHIIFRSVNGLRGSHLWKELFDELYGVPDSCQVQIATGETDSRKNRVELYLTSLESGKLIDTTPSLRGDFRFRASTVDLQKIQMSRAQKVSAPFSAVCDWVDSQVGRKFDSQLQIYEYWSGKVKAYGALETVEQKLVNFQHYKPYFGLRNWYARLGSRADAELTTILETRVAIGMVHMREVEIADQVKKVVKQTYQCEKNREEDGMFVFEVDCELRVGEGFG